MRNLVLWGHDLSDYREMFALSDQDLNGKILEYNSGPTAFNYQMSALGKKVISCDNLFLQQVPQLTKNANQAFDEMYHLVLKNEQLFEWGEYQNAQGLAAKRRQGLEQFLKDFAQDKAHERYIGCDALRLPFEDFQFDLVLCSHFLFAKQEQQDLSYHLKTILELTRVAKEVRIFPLLDREGEISPFIGPILLELNNKRLGVEVSQVPYTLQKKGNAMLRVWAQKCDLPQ